LSCIFRLCLDSAHKHRPLLEAEFESLPKILQERLEMKLVKCSSEEAAREEEEAGNARTCSIS
jgi:hypothetical protein